MKMATMITKMKRMTTMMMSTVSSTHPSLVFQNALACSSLQIWRPRSPIPSLHRSGDMYWRNFLTEMIKDQSSREKNQMFHHFII